MAENKEIAENIYRQFSPYCGDYKLKNVIAADTLF